MYVAIVGYTLSITVKCTVRTGSRLLLEFSHPTVLTFLLMVQQPKWDLGRPIFEVSISHTHPHKRARARARACPLN
jgi:hypothetical protein